MRLTSAINFFLVTYELSLSKKNLPSSDRGTHAYEKEIRRSIRNLTKVNDYIQCMALTFWNVVSVLKNTFAYLMSYWTSFSAGLDKLHARRRACTQRARKEVILYMKLRARKSIKTPLGRTPMLFKIVSYFCVWDQLILGKIRYDIHNFFQLRNCC